MFFAQRLDADTTWADWVEISAGSGFALMNLDCRDNAHILHYCAGSIDNCWDRYYTTNVSGGWVTQEFNFGRKQYEVLGIPTFMVDAYDLAHAMFRTAAEGTTTKSDLVYYAASVIPFNTVSLAEAIDFVYFDSPKPCGVQRYDQNCDEIVDGLDIQWLISYVFGNGSWGCR